MDPETLIHQRYTGPWVSNGKFQESVAFGDQAPLGALDSFSRLHDTAYALYEPGIMRKAADSVYHDRVSNLPGKLPSIAGDAVLYGNAGMHSLGNITSAVTTGFKYGSLPGAFLGLVYGGVENMFDLNTYLTHGSQAKKDIIAMELTDPFPQYQRGPQIVERDSTLLRGILPKGETKSLKVEPDLRVPATRVYTGSEEPASTTAAHSIIPKFEIDRPFSVSPPTQWLGGGEYITMVKTKQQKQKKKSLAVRQPKQPKQKAKMKRNTLVGPISSISTAPVAIGNSVRGCTSDIISSGINGSTVRGRDFMFAPIGTNVTTWTMCGGTPLSPAAFADTTLANHMRMYNKFRFKYLAIHYITSSPTSSTGDVMIYYGKDRSSVFLNQTSPQLLGFVLSDTNTVIGPQWTNHSAVLEPDKEWKLTDYGMHDGVAEYADGEVFLLSKTATNESPGYVIFDYVVEFAQHQLQPRLLEFPIPRIQYFQTNLGLTATAVNLGESVNSVRAWVVKGNNLSNAAATSPSGATVGDVYKVIFDITNSASGAWVAATTANLMSLRVDTVGAGAPMTLADGMTMYLVRNQLGAFALYPNATSAFACEQDTPIVYGITAAITFNVQCWMSYVGSLNTKNLLPNY